MALKTMLDQMYEAKKKHNDAKHAIKPEMIAEALGAAVPEGHVLVWGQFTQYFNDGAPCTFSVHEPIVVVDTGKLEDITSPWKNDTGNWTDELGEAWGQVCDDDLMEAVFGDHKLICVRRGGEFLVQRYTSHD